MSAISNSISEFQKKRNKQKIQVNYNSGTE